MKNFAISAVFLAAIYITGCATADGGRGGDPKVSTSINQSGASAGHDMTNTVTVGGQGGAGGTGGKTDQKTDTKIDATIPVK